MNAKRFSARCSLRRSLGVLVVAGLVLAHAAAADAATVAINFNGESPNGGSGFANGVGLVFTVGSRSLSATSLGATGFIADWNDTTHTSTNLNSNPLTVKLWRVSDGVQLASVSLTSPDWSTTWHPSPNSYNMPYLRELLAGSGITLISGVQYQVALYNTAGGAREYINNLDTAVIKPVVSSNITFNQNRFASAGGQIMPATPDGAATTPRYGGPTFEFDLRPTMNWNSTSSTVWDMNTTANWLNTGTAASDVFVNGDVVQFNNTAGLQTSVTLASTVQPFSVTVNSSTNNYTLSGAGGIGGTSTLTKTGTSTLTLTAANTYTGGTTLSQGTLSFANGSLGSSGAITMDGGALQWNGANTQDISSRFTMVNGKTATVDTNGNNVTFATAIGGSTSGGLTKTGSGTLTLSANSTYTGNTVVSGGTLTTNGSINGGGSVTVDAGAVWNANVTNATNAKTWNISGTVNGGSGVAQTLGNTTLSGGTLAGGTGLAGFGSYTITGASFSISHTGDVMSTISAAGTNGGLTLAGATNLTFNVADGLAPVDLLVSGTIANSGAGTAGITKSGAGVMQLSGANTYIGPTTVSSGVLNIQNANALGTIAGGTSVTAGAALQIQGTITTLAEPLTLNGAGVANDGALRNILNNNTFAGPITLGSAVRINSDSGTLTLNNATAITSAQDLTFGGAGNITVSTALQTGAHTLTKDGAGTLTLNNVNTYTGGTTVSGGTLVLGAGGAAGTIGGVLNIGTGATVLTQATNPIGFAANRVTTVNINGGTFTAGVAGNMPFWGTTLNLTGASVSASNAGAVIFLGTDANASNVPTAVNVLASGTTTTFSGTSGATVNLSQTAVVFDVANGAAATDLQVSLPLVGSGGLTKSGAGVMQLTGANSYTGATLVNGGTLELNRTAAGASLAASSAITIDNATLRLTGNQFNVLNGNALVIQNGGILTADSTANNAHNVGGATGITLSGGTMTSAGGSDAGFGNFVIGTGGVNVIGAAQSTISANSIGWAGARTFTVADVTAGTDLLVSSVIKDSSGVASLTKAGAGLMNLTGTAANTYTGTTSVSAGVLKISKEGALGTAAGNTSVTAGAALEMAGGVTYATAEPLALNGTGVGGAGALFMDDGGASTFAGPITMATNATIGAYNGSTLTLTGNINKNGTTVTFLGNGSATNVINLNGGVGPNPLPNSDLEVDNVTVNVNSAIDYAGPTLVRNSGILNINNGGSATTTALTVGSAGTGTVNQFTGGDTNVSGNVQVNAGSSYNQSGGTATIGGDVNVSGTYAQSGGTHSLNGAGSDLTVSGAGQYNLSGGTLDFNDYVGAGTAWTPNNASTLTAPTGAQFAFTGGSLVDVSLIDVNGTTFTQNGGNFVVGRNGVGVAAESTIDGSFSLLGGVLRLDVFGDDLTPEACCDNVASNNDQLTVMGAALLDSTVALDYVGIYDPEFGDAFTLICAEAITLGDGFNISGGFFRLIDTGNEDFPVALQAIVPEPAALAVWSLVGLVAVAGTWQARRRSSAAPRFIKAEHGRSR